MNAHLLAWQLAEMQMKADAPSVHVESWRVVLDSLPDRPVTADATVRVRVGDHRVVATGEGPDIQAAIEVALHVAALDLAKQSVHQSGELLDGLRRVCELAVGARSANVVDVVIDAVHRDALLGRLGVLVSSHVISHFSYAVEPGGERARAVVRVHGDQRQVERVTNKLRRLVDVRTVTVRRAPRYGNESLI